MGSLRAAPGPVGELLAVLPLVDAHCHFVLAGRLDPATDAATFDLGCTEAGTPAPPGVSYVDGQLGLAVRRWCAPVLDLPAHVPIADYLARRAELHPTDVLHSLLGAAGLERLLVDTGITTDVAGPLCSAAELSAAAEAPVHEVVRLERVAEDLAASRGPTAAGFAAAYLDALHAATAGAVGVKSIVAYRAGLDVDPGRPSAAEVRAAASGWLAAGAPRLTDRILLRFLLWAGLDACAARGLPVQLHTGFGDRDLALHRADPSLLQPFLAAAEPTGVPIVLLHCYPYHRQAAWLAAVYPQVYADVGLTVAHVGARATQVLAEFTELAPFGKLLFSTDAYLLPELYLVGAAQFRHALATLLDAQVADGALATADALRLARLVAAGNANRVYRLLLPRR